RRFSGRVQVGGEHQGTSRIHTQPYVVSRGRRELAAHVQRGTGLRRRTHGELAAVVLHHRYLRIDQPVATVLAGGDAQVLRTDRQPGGTALGHTADGGATDAQVLVRDQHTVGACLGHGHVQQVPVAHEVRHVPV